ncbi:concanavalin A-like lectin/glucanase superfamily protein [Mucilaginibacter frigoritolerans]|uniref:Concanavalin A-like lectin/glucanase superfamily protein n=1 Tax=Mucilaginibacter frigoritolerans TaxID=652788 RepID=A0A562TRN0_9SPHI|nr:LamG-like jellyroll fold domain-containing protein [Mucilaginibacter frigoritolerans]TWI95898.1 concanavalin A-like lectin/glucanase superfamily protein [Mucilaginibacter frigoritolerans]
MIKMVTFNNLLTKISGTFILVFIFINNINAQIIGSVAVSGSPGCGAGSVTLTASGGLPAGGTYNWYATSTSTTVIATGATYLPQTSGTYYVSYTSAGIPSARVSGTATIVANPIIATAQSVTAGATLALPFTSGSTNDVSGSGNNGIAEGSPTVAQPTTDRFGAANNAYSFDGVSQYITTKTNITSAPQDFSISLWFNTTTTTGGKLAGWGNQQTGSSGNYDHHIYLNNAGQIYFGVYYNGFRCINTTASYNDGKWHHVVLTFSSTNGVKMYVDGVIKAEDSTNKVAETEAGYWRFGYDNLQNWPSPPTSYFYKGLLDDIAIFNHALTDADVYALYGGGAYQLCDGSVQLFANTVANSTYSWTGPNGFTSTLQNPINTNASPLGAYAVTVTQNAQCISTLNVSVNTPVVYTWTGNQSSDITLINNWNNTTFGISNQLPFFDGSVSLLIPNVTTCPQLTQSISVYNLTLNSGAKLDLNGQTLTIGCNIVNSGTINYSSTAFPTVIFNGTTATQTYTGSNTVNTAEFGNLTINNTYSTVSGGITTYGKVTIKGGPVDVFNTLTMTSGNLFVDNTNTGALTLKSNATTTAAVGIIPSAYSITGSVKVERYITGGAGYRGYRLLSSPVSSGTDSYSNKIYSVNYLKDSTFLTGTDGTAGGFSKAGNPTLYLYRENLAPLYSTFLNSNNRGVKDIANSPNYLIDGDGGGTTYYNIPVGNGFLFFFRGGLTTSSPYVSTSTPKPATLTTSGTLNQGSVQVIDWYNPNPSTPPNLGYTVIAGTPATPAGNSAVRGFNLVGNPYASSIDWNGFYNSNASLETIIGVNVNPTAWEFITVSDAYGTYNAQTGASTNGGTNIIGSGQGFFVKASGAGSATLQFTENAKSSAQHTGATILALEKSAGTAAYSQDLRLSLSKDTTSKNEVLIGFNQGSTKKYNQREDDLFFPGQSSPQSAWVTSVDSFKVVSKWFTLPKINQPDTANIGVSALTSGQYTLTRTELKAVPAVYDLWLIDTYKKDSLDIKNNSSYIFNIDLNDTASFGKNRFKVIIREDAALAIHLLDFTAVKVTGGAKIDWKTENEQNYTTFIVERSTDNGVTFTAIDSFLSDARGSYSFLDKNPVNGIDLYRLKVLAIDSTVSYSNIVRLIYGSSTNIPNVMIYPNPTSGIVNVTVVQNNAAYLDTQSTGAKLYDIKIISITGSVILTGTLSQAVWQGNVSNFPPSTYIVRVLNDSNKSLVGEAPFIKR